MSDENEIEGETLNLKRKSIPDPSLKFEIYNNIILFNGYQFCNCRSFTTKIGAQKHYWRCIEARKTKCKGTLATLTIDGEYQVGIVILNYILNLFFCVCIYLLNITMFLFATDC